ncbi:MAG: ABC transporter ATP-binding protein [Roseovarius sp.]
MNTRMSPQRAASTKAAEVLLECRGLSKHFGALQAVNNVSFSVGKGEAIGIAGPNGAGKSTLFDLVSSNQPLSSGQIIYDGQDVTNTPPEELCHQGIARTFQLNAAFDSMTALENVRVASYFGREHSLLPKLWFDRHSKDHAMQALERVGMADKADQIVGNMPVLGRKLVMLAGALAIEPKLLLMDEPVGGLTPPEMAIFEDVVREVVNTGVTLVIVEHVMKFLFALVDRVLIMHQGELIFEGSRQEMLADTQVVEIYLGKRTAEMLIKSVEST